MSPNVILVDAAYLDRVAASFRGHYGAQLGRALPKADLAQWLVCASLDAGMKGDVQVILLHDREEKVLSNIAPGNFSQELDGQAFSEPGLGEYTIACCPVERITTLSDLCAESLEALQDDKTVQRIAVVYDFDGQTAFSRDLTKRIVRLCAKQPTEKDAENESTPKDITLFTMLPIEKCSTPQQILGFSILAALGIAGEEV